MERKLLVIGATGRTGRNTVEFLTARGHQVRALVHRRDERAEQLTALGADVVEGDVLDFDSVFGATRGIDALYFTFPIHPARRDAASHASQHHWVAERLLDRCSFGVTHLRPTFFAEWLIKMWDGSGELRFPFEDGRHAPVAARDQARVIAGIWRTRDRTPGSPTRCMARWR
jgi:uncharacterized protein YbjT (DUF2867 family)